MKTKSVLAVAGLVALLSLQAQPVKEFPKVEDQCFTEAGGAKVIQLSTEVSASPSEIWDAFTTADGWRSFAVGFAVVEMRIGGIIETSYRKDASPGNPDNIKNEIVAYIPNRMLAIRCIQAPRNFEHKEEFFRTSTVLEWAPIDSKRCRVTLTAAGFRATPAFDELFARFRWGNAYTLQKLRERFDPGARETATPPDVTNPAPRPPAGGQPAKGQ
jgi:uncharacterized protein YndB with AHSA1/START domain